MIHSAVQGGRDKKPLWCAQDIAAATGAPLVACPPIMGVSTDTRTLQPGDLYVPLQGTRFDGHAYIKDAFARGAAAAFSAILIPGAPLGAIFYVPDTLQALENLAKAARARAKARILAVTGSAGKTTTKEVLRGLLERQGSIWATPGSYNNHWGVPISVAGLKQETDRAVFELGMNHAGELGALSMLVRPHAALITTVLPAHIGNFGSLEQIALAKSEVFSGLDPHAPVILNADDSTFDLLKCQARGREVITFGCAADAHWRLEDVSRVGNQMFVRACVQGRRVSYNLDFEGAHWPVMSLGWLAAVQVLGADVDQAMQDLSHAQLGAGRGALIRIPMAPGHFHVIDETANANPDAMRAALLRLTAHADTAIKRRIAVLGDMGELGDCAPQGHASLRAVINGSAIDLVHVVGPYMTLLWESLPAHQRGILAQTPQDLAIAVAAQAQPGDLYMIKSSRGAAPEPRLQCVLNALKEKGMESPLSRSFP